MKEDVFPYGKTYGNIVVLPSALLDVGVKWMDDLRKKAKKVSQTLQKAGVPHAVIGGLAVAAHVARVNPAAQRNTQDLDILLKREDLERAKEAMDQIGYRFRKVMKLHAFMPKERGHKFVEGVHVVWANEKVREDYVAPAPDVSGKTIYHGKDGVQYVGVLELLTMKLTSFRHKDITHVQDLMDQRLITKKVEAALPPELKKRLQQVKEDTERERL